MEACGATLQHYLDIGSVQALADQTETAGVWSALFPVPKKNTDKVKGCIDLTTINPYLQYEHFKMEGLHTVQAQLRRRDYMWKVDMSDFYMHLLIAEADRLYFRFQFEGIKYECTAMPFGLAPAPRIATKFLQPVIRYLRRRQVRCMAYIDDVCGMARSRQKAVRDAQLTVNTLHRLGFGIHPDKIQVDPTQSMEMLGTQVNSVTMQFRVPRVRLKSLHRKISDTLRLHYTGKLTIRKFASLIGSFNSVRGAVQSAPLHIWPLLHLQKSMLSRMRSWNDPASLSPRVIQELEWWLSGLKFWNGRSVIPQKHQHIITTDASKLGWGGWWHKVGSRHRKQDEARGFFSRRESRNSSNWRELTAVSHTLRAAAPMLRNTVVLIETDNIVTKAYINHMGGRKPILNAIAQDIWKTAHQFGLQLVAVHRPGRLNQRADKLSRWSMDSTDLQLLPSLFQRANRRWGPHTVDLFANRLNRQVRRYVSWRPDPFSVANDGLTFPLTGENAWCFPPEALIQRLLAKLIREQATVTLVAPLWPSKPWWPELQALRIDRPIILPPGSQSLKTVGLNKYSGFQHLNLALWRISGSHSKISRYQMRLAH